ncbi:MAG: hypothetical protein RIE84_11285 [Parvibaculum sp.]|uniref:hypothetical protein n=1 Tax=Parvibaculum sp. TaxID=2024848 RepID=UPI0032EB4167
MSDHFDFGRECEIEEWTRHGKIRDRHNGPAVTIRDKKSGEVLEEQYVVDGQLQRVGGPAVVRIENGQRREKIYQQGSLHNPDGPSETVTDLETGIVVEETWHLQGLEHRTDGPAFTMRHPQTGVVLVERWSLYGVIERGDDGPSQIHRDPSTGRVRLEQWHTAGNLDREVGPASIQYDTESGKIVQQRYFHNGVESYPERPASPSPKA